MPPASSVTINLPPAPVERLDSADTIAALRAIVSTQLENGQDIVVNGDAALGDGGGGIFVWVELSTADDDGARVIRPDDVPPLSAGRWIMVGQADAPPVSTYERERLIADRTYYVRTDGSDSNDGSANTSGSAFLTIQKAINTAYQTLDLNGYSVIIRVASGTYSTPLFLRNPLLGATNAQPIQIIGDEVAPENVLISVTSSNALTVSNGAYLLLAGVKCQTAIGGYGWFVTSNAFLEHRDCVFGNVVSDMIITQHHASVKAIGATTVEGNAVSFAHATKRSIIDFASQTLTFSGTPSFSTYVWGINDAAVNLDSATIIGTVSGRTLVHDNGILNVSSLTGNFLGGFAPEVEEGGKIAYGDVEATRTLYVRGADGNDANDGRFNTAARAFKTITGAIDYLAKQYFDPKGWASGAGWVIQLADATYTETVRFRDVPYYDVTLRGNNGAPANVIISSANDGLVVIGLKTLWRFEGVTVTAANGSGIRAEQNSVVTFQNVRWGTCSAAHIYAITGAVVIATDNYAIPNNAAYHVLARLNGSVDIQNRTVTLSGTPNFSGSFVLAEQAATVRALNMTFSGSATGTRYNVRSNAVIDTNGGGASYLPGNAAGSNATGGQYI